MGELDRGIYEELVTARLREVISGIDPGLLHVVGLQAAEAPDRIALHLARQVEAVIASLKEEDRAKIGVAVARSLLARLGETAGVDAALLAPEFPHPDAQMLHAVHGQRPDGAPDEAKRPLIPLLDTTLLTAAPDEPSLARQLEAEIHSAHAIDLVMAFIRRSGIRPFLAPLRRHIEAGRSLRILTTTYTNTTEQAALDQLAALGAQIRVSYDLDSTRLHAKAWLFHRARGVSTAYVGSSNMTFSAQVSGLEWNVRIAEARNRSIIEKFRAVFDTYWNSGDFREYDPVDF